jgi:hypothetical protein
LVHVGSIETESKIPPGIKKEEEEEEEEKIVVVVVVSYCLSLIRPLGLRTGSIVVVPCDILLASFSLHGMSRVDHWKINYTSLSLLFPLLSFFVIWELQEEEEEDAHQYRKAKVSSSASPSFHLLLTTSPISFFLFFPFFCPVI